MKHKPVLHRIVLQTTGWLSDILNTFHYVPHYTDVILVALPKNLMSGLIRNEQK